MEINYMRIFAKILSWCRWGILPGCALLELPVYRSGILWYTDGKGRRKFDETYSGLPQL